MNLQSLVVVILRLMALDFLLRVAVLLTPQMLQYFRIYERSPLNDSRSFMILPWLVLIGMIAAAALLWFFALSIARFVTRGVPHDLSFGAMSLVDCYSVAFLAVGLFYISGHLPQVLNWTDYLFKAAASRAEDPLKQGVPWYQVSQAFIPFIVGVVLFVNGRRWAVTLARRQTESVSSSAPSSKKHETDA